MPNTYADAFAAAMVRHYRDGAHLFGQGRHVSADHLFGFAAECAIKSLLLRTQIATYSGSGKPQVGSQSLGHLPSLATTVLVGLTGRGALRTAQHVAALAQEYADWSVFDRYEHDAVQPVARVAMRMKVTREMIEMHDVVVMVGGLT